MFVLAEEFITMSLNILYSVVLEQEVDVALNGMIHFSDHLVKCIYLSFVHVHIAAYVQG